MVELVDNKFLLGLAGVVVAAKTGVERACQHSQIQLSLIEAQNVIEM